MNRCNEYWILDQAWVKAERDPVSRSNGKAQELLLELQKHLHCCHQCRIWWIEMMELMKNE